MGTAAILAGVIIGLYFIPKSYEAQNIIRYKSAYVLEYMVILMFSLLLIAIGVAFVIKQIQENKQ